jgi:hypothetical protein
MKRGTLRMDVEQWAADCAKRERWQSAANQVNAGARAAVPDAPSPGAAPAPLKLKQTTVPESAILAAVLTALRLHPRVAWAHRMNTGAYAVGDRFVRFGFPGLADIIGQTVSGAFLAVECKRVGKEPTDEQRAFLDLVARSGGVSFVARSVDDVSVGLAT